LNRKSFSSKSTSSTGVIMNTDSSALINAVAVVVDAVVVDIDAVAVVVVVIVMTEVNVGLKCLYIVVLSAFADSDVVGTFILTFVVVVAVVALVMTLIKICTQSIR